jgi:hypothetical protein
MMNENVLPGIDHFFIDEMKKEDGSYPLYKTVDEEKKRLYLLNYNGKKLLQLKLKEEPFSKGFNPIVQIILITYKFSFANVYKDNSSLPQKYRIQDDINFTYHGGKLGEKNPKIQLKVDTKNNKHITLVDSSFMLTGEELLLIPICSIYPGYLSSKSCDDEVRKQAHIFVPLVVDSCKIDIFFSGVKFNLSKYFETMVSSNIFFDLDFMIARDGCPLNYCKMTNPVTIYKINSYYIFVRSSLSKYQGRPYLQFYDNYNYYQKFMNRRVAMHNQDNSLTWSNMHDEERRINNGYYKPPNA